MSDAPRSTTQLEHLIQDPELFDVGVEYSAIRDILLEVVSKVNALSNKAFKVSAPVVEDINSDEIKQLSEQFISLQEESKQQYSEFNNELHELKAFFSFQLKDIREKYDRHITRLTNSISNPESSRFPNEPQIEYITDDDRVDQLSRQVENLTARFDNLLKTSDINNLGKENSSSRQQIKQQKQQTPEKIQPIILGSSDKSTDVNTSIPKMDLNLSKKEINEIGDLTGEVPLTIPDKPTSQPVSPVLKPIVDITRKEVKKDPRVDDLVLQVRSITDELKNGSERTKKMISTINSLIKEYEKQSSDITVIKMEMETRNDEFDRIYDKMAGISVGAQKDLQNKFDELVSSKKEKEGSDSASIDQSIITQSSSNQNTINQATITALEKLKNSFVNNFEKLDSNYRPQISYLKQEINQLKNQIKKLGGTIEEIAVPKLESPIPEVDLQIPIPTNDSTPNAGKNTTANNFSIASVQTDESLKDIPFRKFSTSTPNGSVPNTIDIFELDTFSSSKEGSKSKITTVTSNDNHKIIPQDDLILGTPGDSSSHVSSISTIRPGLRQSGSSNGKSEFSFEHILSLTIISNDIHQLIFDAVKDQLNQERLKELSKIETKKPPNSEIDVNSIMKQISDLRSQQDSNNNNRQPNENIDNNSLIIATSIVDKFKPIIDNHEERIAALQKHIDVLQDQQEQSKKEIQQVKNIQKNLQTPSIIKNHRPTIVSPRLSSKKYSFNSSKQSKPKKNDNSNVQENQNENQEIVSGDEKNKNPPFVYDPVDVPSRPQSSGDGKGRKGSKIVLNIVNGNNESDENDTDGNEVVSFNESDFMKIKSKMYNLERAYKSLSKKVSDLQTINSSRPQTATSPIKGDLTENNENENENGTKETTNKEDKKDKESEKNKDIKKSFSTISIPPVPKKLDMMDKITPNFKSQTDVKNIDQEIDVAMRNLSRSGSVPGTSSMPLFDVVERERNLQKQALEDQETQNNKKATSPTNHVRINLPLSQDQPSRPLTSSTINFNSSRANLNVNNTEQIEKIVSDKLKDYKIYSEDQFRILRKHIQNIINDIDLLKAPVQGMIVMPNTNTDFNSGNYGNNYNSSGQADPDENTIKGLKKRFDLKTNDLEDQINDLRREILQFLQKLSTPPANNEISRSTDQSGADENGSSRKNQDSKKNKKINDKKESQKKPVDNTIVLEKSESFLRLKKKFMEEINSPRMLKTTHYQNLDAPEPISERKKKLIVENRINESEDDIKRKENQIHKSFSTSIKSDNTPNKSESSLPKRKISESLSDPSIVLKLDKDMLPPDRNDKGDGIITYGNEIRRFWGRRVPQYIHEFNVRSAEPVKEVIETMVLPYIVEMRSEFQKKVDTALEKSRLAEESILGKVDKEFVNDFFRKMRMTIVELKNQIDEVKSTVPDKVTHEELHNLATDLYKSVTKDQSTTVGTKSYRCLFCGAPKQNVSGMITDKNVVEALGDPQQARASQNPTMIFGSDKQLYKGRGNYGRTGIASKMESRKIPPLRATTAVPPKE